MYQAILFDLDDTLLDFAACEITALRKAFLIEGLDVDDDAWLEIWQTYKPISDSCWIARSQNNFSRDEIIEYSIHQTLNKLNYDFADSSNIAKRYWTTFCHTACLNDGVAQTIQFLANKYKLGIITNGYANSQRNRISASSLESYFQSIVVSEEVGCAKPAKQIFEIALKDLQVEPQATMFVGDSIKNDFIGANNADLDFCHYQKRAKSITEVNFKPKYAIAQMIDLIKILNKN